MSRLPSSNLDAARKWPMLVMHEPMKTSSILAPATSDSVFTSSGSFGQALDLQDAAAEDVLLALLGNRQQSGLDGVQRYRVDEIAQGDPRLHRALEAHQHAFRHVQRHHAGGRGEGDEP